MQINKGQKSGRQRHRRGNRGSILFLLKAKGTSISIGTKRKVFGGKERVGKDGKDLRKQETMWNKQKWKRKAASSHSPWHLVYGFTFGRHKRYRNLLFSKNLHCQDLILPCGPYWYFKQSRSPTPYMFVKRLWALVEGHNLIFCFSCCQ